MENKTTVIPPVDPDDKTMVIPPRPPADKTMVIPSAEGKQYAAGQQKIKNTIKCQLISSLSGLIGIKRAVVDDTIVIAEAVNPRLRSALNMPDESVCAADDSADSKLPDINESYQLDERPFASGGQGSIHKASNRFLKSVSAVKSLHPDQCSDEPSRDAFFTEAQLTASLDHPGIIPVHGLFSSPDNGLHLAMKLIKGCTLKDYLKRITQAYELQGIKCFDEKRSIRNRLELFLRICDAISCAHAKEILHRDLKPENIMLGNYRETYVTDWGIALPFKDAVQLDKVSGTPGYIAPEMLKNKCADQRADIYSLGLILFELVTLNPAFSDNDLNVLLEKVQLGKHNPLLHRFGFKLDIDLAAVILKAIAVDPDQRYTSVEAMARDLRKYMANEEVSARPDNFFNKLARWGANHRRGMMLTIMFLMLMGACSIVYVLHKEVLGSIRQQARTEAVDQVHSNVVSIANHLEKNIQRVEYQLEGLQMSMLFTHMQRSPGIASEKIQLPMNRLEVYQQNPPASFVYAPAYNHRIDPEGVCVFNYRHKEIPQSRLNQLAIPAVHMQKILLEILFQSSGINSPDALLTGRQPAKSVYAAWSDGTFICYPGMSSFASGYDPTQRVWYKTALSDPGHPCWIEPYHDANSNNELIMTCSIAVTGVNDELIGVAAMDFSLQKLSEAFMQNEGKYRDFIIEKMLIDQTGKVFFRASGSGDTLHEMFDDKRLIEQMLSLKYGTLTYDTPHGEILLAFAHIKQLNILYVESVDLPELMDNLPGR